jgi:hypothetical protein
MAPRHPSTTPPMARQAKGTPLIVIAGQEYGTGSSRDWAAKGTNLLGVKVVVAQSFERIHRSNLVGMGVLPLQFKEGTTAQTLKLDGSETYDVVGLTPHQAAAGPHPQDHAQGRVGRERQRPLPHRYAHRDRLLPARRHPALRSPPDCGALDARAKSEIESARLVLEAHESLVNADAANAAKFQDVLAFLRNRVESR